MSKCIMMIDSHKRVLETTHTIIARLHTDCGSHSEMSALNVPVAMYINGITRMPLVIPDVHILWLGYSTHGHVAVLPRSTGWAWLTSSGLASRVLHISLNGIKHGRVGVLDSGVGPGEEGVGVW